MRLLENISAILLDIDGTLIDSNEAHAQAWGKALELNGFDGSVDRVKPLIGMGGDKLIPAVAGVEAESPDGKRLTASYRKIFRMEFLRGVKPLPGARSLCQFLKDRGLTLVLASSCDPEMLSELTDIAGVTDLLDDETTSGDVEDSKPDPDIVAAALRKAGCASDEAILIGDTPYDVEAARRSNVASIGLRSGGWKDEDLAGAAFIANDPKALLDHFQLAEAHLGEGASE